MDFKGFSSFVASPTFKLMNALLFVFGFMTGGLLSLNLHELIHIKCAYAGECFGDSDWIVLASELHFLEIFGLVTSGAIITLALFTLLLSRKITRALDKFREGNRREVVVQTACLYLVCAFFALLISSNSAFLL